MLTTQPTVNLGTLKLGVPHKFKYTFTNDYKESVTITQLIKGCNSCTEASINKQVLGVGDTVDLDVVFTPGSTGINRKSINVQYEVGHAKHPEHVIVTFNATVE